MLVGPYIPEADCDYQSIKNACNPECTVSDAQIKTAIQQLPHLLPEEELSLESQGTSVAVKLADMYQKSLSQGGYGAVRNIIIIQGNYAVVGHVEASQIQIGDYNAIRGQLEGCGVDLDQRQELERILAELNSAKEGDRSSSARGGFAWVKRNAPKIGALGETIRRWIETLSH